MKTASYFTYRGLGRVGISIGRPRGISGYRIYRPLAPRGDMLKMTYEQYREIYFGEILAPLDPEKVAEDLQRLTGDYEPVLLCFEKPPFDDHNWCHRRMVAEWLEKRLGIDIPEINPGLPFASP